ncbi:response regulator transcription factor [Streptomyces virginiae]|uniref:response regulator n=1 Tax=Streptomyces virginiae TaxID=1961 RepID=UPI0036B22F50
MSERTDVNDPNRPNELHDIRVMVVDDHPMWRDAVARDLAAAGFDVVATAGDGPEAVRRAHAVTPDVLVLDLNLPGMPGVQVCKELVGANPALRVLVLSASGEHADVLEAVKSGATGYLLKSAGAQELIDAVRRTAAGDPVFTPGLAGLVRAVVAHVEAALPDLPEGDEGERGQLADGQVGEPFHLADLPEQHLDGVVVAAGRPPAQQGEGRAGGVEQSTQAVRSAGVHGAERPSGGRSGPWDPTAWSKTRKAAPRGGLRVVRVVRYAREVGRRERATTSSGSSARTCWAP